MNQDFIKSDGFVIPMHTAHIISTGLKAVCSERTLYKLFLHTLFGVVGVSVQMHRLIAISVVERHIVVRENNSALRSVLKFNANIVIIFHPGECILCLCVMKETVVVSLDKYNLSVQAADESFGGNRPYYPELLTMRRVNDDFDYFKRLHECVLTKCTKELKEADLLDLFDIMGADVSDEEIDDFGEKDYILERISKELNVQFNTRKQRLLKTLYAYIAHSSTLDDMDCFSMFGTNSFNLVWEKVCAEVFDNQLHKLVGGLKLPLPLSDKYYGVRHQELISLIEKPKWIGKRSDGGAYTKEAKDTLIPDIITIAGDMFIIFDAKYYNIQMDEKKELRGQPGIESVTKQYLYQLAYKDFIEVHGFISVKNCFLMPTDGEQVDCRGFVEMSMLADLGLENIMVRLLPATQVYEHYLSQTHFNIKLLQLN